MILETFQQNPIRRFNRPQFRVNDNFSYNTATVDSEQDSESADEVSISGPVEIGKVMDEIHQI